MEKGIIFTQDKKDIEVFFLKPQLPASNLAWEQHPTEPNTWIVDDETAEALIEDNKDCCEDLKATYNPTWSASLNEQDVNENSAGGGAHSHWHGVCCPVGHKGVKGPIGIAEDEADIFEAISECLEKFSATDLNVNDSGSRDILSITITRKIKDLL